MIVRTQASGAPVQVVVNVHIAPPTATIDLALGVRVDFLVNDDAGHAMPQHPIHVVGDRPLELRTDRDGKSCVSGLPEGTFQMAAGDAAPYEELTFGPSHVARRNLYTGAQLVQSYGAEDVAASAARNESCLPY